MSVHRRLVIGFVVALMCLAGCGTTAHAHKIARRKSAAPKLPARVAAYLDRVPTFGPRPAAVKVKLPTGNAAAWLEKVPTDQPVAFLTIDDGWIKRPEALPLLERAHVPVTLFLTVNAIKDDVRLLRPAAGGRRGDRGPHDHPYETPAPAL